MADQLTEEQIAKFKEVFSRFENEDGIIAADTLGPVIRALGQNPTDDELKELAKDVNTGKNDIIEFPAFLEMMARKLNDNNIEEELREAFRFFDIENNGLISSTQLRSIIANTVENITDQEIDEIVSDADVDHNGQIKYDDLITSLLSK